MKTLTLIGIGTGNENFLTVEAKNALGNAEIIFGARRLLEVAGRILNRDFKSECIYKAEDILACLDENPLYKNAAVVFSGDVGFFSGAREFYEMFCGKSGVGEWSINVLPGISCAVYFAAKLKKSWQNWKFLSLHGEKCNVIEQIRKNPACFFIMSGKKDIEIVYDKLRTAFQNGILSSIKCFIGSNLSYENEKIWQTKNLGEWNLGECGGGECLGQNSLFVLLVENEKFENSVAFLSDDDFLRAKKIPMTKKEIRRISILALELEENSILYDIGSGTGSISVEAARIMSFGHIFAFEKNEDAFLLTKKNVEKFCLENVSCVRGEVPEIFKKRDISCEQAVDFLIPTHAFIGGSSGNLGEICLYLLKKNPRIRIVANFISLENLSEMQKITENLESENKIKNLEIRQISVSGTEKIGKFHLMKAQNPVFVVSFSGSGSI